MLRSKKLTEKSLLEDDVLSATDIRGIAAHEMGHVLQHHYSNFGLEIAKKAYYNIYKEELNSDLLGSILSKYSKTMVEGIYHEIIPEILSKHITSPNKFTSMFIELLKERWGV